MTESHDATLEKSGVALATSSDDVCYELTLFVSGASDLSARAVANARQLCDIHLPGRHRLAVVDVHEDPSVLGGTLLMAVPTLVKNAPPPVRKLVGDLSDTARVLVALDLHDVTADLPSSLS